MNNYRYNLVIKELRHQIIHLKLVDYTILTQILLFTQNNTMYLYAKEKNLNNDILSILDKQIMIITISKNIDNKDDSEAKQDHEQFPEYLEYLEYLVHLLKTKVFCLYSKKFIEKSIENNNTNNIIYYSKIKKTIYVKSNDRIIFDINEIQNMSKNSILNKKYDLGIHLYSFFKSTHFSTLDEIRNFLISKECREIQEKFK